ncbi:MAG: LptF/LptG family permease [Candidatus Omnitrophica bacterium]|nr:LptF/LptG family permease [Candidatus Omnitrophota bacterium]
MKIIDRYMVKGFLSPFIWCLFIFTIMAVIIDIFSFIENIVKYKIPGASLAAFYVYYCPTIILQVAPMAVLLSTIFVLSNLNKNNEITAMKSSGISLWRIVSPVILLGLIISICSFIISDRVVPISSKVANLIRREELEKDMQKSSRQKIIDNVAVYGTGNRIVFARTYNTEKKLLSDIIIHEHDLSENLVSKITAQSGVWTGSGWKFYKVIMWKIDNSGKILSEPTFYAEKTIPIKEKPRDFAYNEWHSEYMSYAELKNYIKNFRGTSTKLVRGLMVDLYQKVSFSVISLIIILIGAPFAIINTRGGVMIGVGMSIAIGLLYYACIAIAIAFGKAGILPPIASAWIGNIVFGIIGIYLINKRT